MRLSSQGAQPGTAMRSEAMPAVYFGITHWPRRCEIVALFAVRAAAEEMSSAALPAPTTTTSRPASCEASR